SRCQRKRKLLRLRRAGIVIGTGIGKEQADTMAGLARSRQRCSTGFPGAPERVETKGEVNASEIDAAVAVKLEQQRRNGEAAVPGVEPEMNEIDIDPFEQPLELRAVPGLDAVAVRYRA